MKTLNYLTILLISVITLQANAQFINRIKPSFATSMTINGKSEENLFTFTSLDLGLGYNFIRVFKHIEYSYDFEIAFAKRIPLVNIPLNNENQDIFASFNAIGFKNRFYPFDKNGLYVVIGFGLGLKNKTVNNFKINRGNYGEIEMGYSFFKRKSGGGLLRTKRVYQDIGLNFGTYNISGTYFPTEEQVGLDNVQLNLRSFIVSLKYTRSITW